MEEHHLSVSRTARYHTLGRLDEEVREVWFVLHGYGQRAASFLRHFQGLDNGQRFFVAPEALSRFYRDGDRVGASWMTRADRLQEIADYVAYLDALYTCVFASFDRDATTVHVLGFSQGTATASRWIAHGHGQIDRLTLWGGDLAQDLDLEVLNSPFRQVSLLLVVGTEDEYIDAARLAREEARLKQHDISFRTITFDGGHHLDTEVLHELVRLPNRF